MSERGTAPSDVDTMSGSDALLWALGADPVLRPTVVAVMMFDGCPDWDLLQARVLALTGGVPRLRSRVVTARATPGRPSFVPDPAFDLATHLRRMRLPAHGNRRDVLDLAQTMATTGFDPALPLWEAVLVEDVGPGQSAVVLKVHHALIDGIGGLRVVGHLLEGGSAGSPGSAPRQQRSEPPCRDGLGHWPLALTGALAHPARSAVDLVALATSVARLVTPAPTPLSPIMRGRSCRRHVEVLDLGLGELRAAATAWKATINDVFVASVLRGLAEYHAEHGSQVSSLRALMPVSVRAPGDPEAGNQFVPARFVLPIHADPADCMAEVRARTTAWKNAPGLALSDVLATLLSTLPPPVARSAWSTLLTGTDFCISDIPGPSDRAWLAGAELETIYALTPPSGAALSASLVSCADRAAVTVTADTAAVPDAAALAVHVADGFTTFGVPPRAHEDDGARS